VAEELDASTVADSTRVLSLRIGEWRLVVKMEIRAHEVPCLMAEAVSCLWSVRQSGPAHRRNPGLDELLDEVAPEGLPPMVIATGGR